MKRTFILLMMAGLAACNEESPTSNAQGEWIKGNESEQIKIIEKHFRGLDNAMIETGYRYQELYWAGQDENWEYAEYQLAKIALAIENALQRRPKRAKSAEHFVNFVLPEMKKSISSKDPIFFNREFENLTMNCNACHTKESVAYFTVKIPLERQSPIRK